MVDTIKNEMSQKYISYYIHFVEYFSVQFIDNGRMV